MAELLNNESFVFGVMSVIAFLVTQGLKWAFVKPFTKNLDKKKKTLINSIILIIAFGSAVLCEFLYSHFWLHSALDINRALSGWGGASGVYGIFEWVLKVISGGSVKLENPYNTEEGKDTTDFIKNITKDGKFDKKDNPIVKEYIEKLDKVK